jgi:hypothetical protein
MRHKKIHERARFLDWFVGSYNKVRRRRTFPHKAVGMAIRLLFPNWTYRGKGAYKTVYKLRSTKRRLVLKVADKKRIKEDFRAYRSIPETVRNRYFAKIYWHTEYTMLQKYGRKTRIPDSELKKLKDVGKRHGLSDIRPDNIRKVGFHFKIVDAARTS